MKKMDKSNLQRRSFLKGAAVSTVAVSSGVITTNAAADQVPEAKAKSDQGYKLTSHVKEYYRLARF